jgi:hypothetical protein
MEKNTNRLKKMCDSIANNKKLLTTFRISADKLYCLKLLAQKYGKSETFILEHLLYEAAVKNKLVSKDGTIDEAGICALHIKHNIS